jgi:hypothetical protein
LSQHRGGDQRRVKPLRIHRLVQKVVSLGADLAPRRARIAADEKRASLKPKRVGGLT